MNTPTPYTRIVRFQRVGLHTDVPDLIAHVKTHDTDPDVVGGLGSLIKDYVRPLLTDRTSLHIDAHPDQPTGRICRMSLDGTATGEPLAEFTVHLDSADLPPRGVDAEEVREIARLVLPAARGNWVAIKPCRTGVVVRIHGGWEERVRDVLIGSGYHAHVIEGVILVSPGQS